jgi:homoserine O-succinyltransferase
MGLRIDAPRQQSVAAARGPQARRGERARVLRIALVNNMPDSALAATERQFASLIEAAKGDLDVRLELVALESVPREAGAREAMRGRYGALGDLVAAPPDALIVTGAEPRTADLTDELYWRELSELIDWARGGVASVLYSCLAAHAAVRRYDGIARRPRDGKLSGVFASEIVGPHELTRDLEAVLTPHSRYNDLAENDLAANGYRVLSRSREAGVEMFVKEGATLEIYWQGHPEYEADTLAREFRRDLMRFTRGETARLPALPKNYLAEDKHAWLEERLGQASRGAGEDLAGALQPKDFAHVYARWRVSAEKLAGNWLNIIAQRQAFAVDAKRGSPAAPAGFTG